MVEFEVEETEARRGEGTLLKIATLVTFMAPSTSEVETARFLVEMTLCDYTATHPKLSGISHKSPRSTRSRQMHTAEGAVWVIA